MDLQRRPQPWMLVSLAWLGPATLAAISTLAQQRLWGNPANVTLAVFWSLNWLSYALLTPGIFALARRWPIVQPNVGRRVLLHLVLALGCCGIWAAIGVSLRTVLDPAPLRGGLAKFALGWFLSTVTIGSAAYLSLVGIEHAFRYFIEARDGELKLARLSEQLTSARLAALQARLNPHFLFNSLNTIAVIVRYGKRRTAARVVERLSDVLRLTLDTKSDEVRLEEELDLVHRYLAVEEARFSDRLVPEFMIAPETVAAAVPSFAIQHLVENALRHGIGKRSKAGHVRVTSHRDGDMLDVTVADDGLGFKPDEGNRRGTGLANTRDRLRTLYGDRASLEVTPAPDTGTIARLRVPFRELEAQRHDDG